MKKTTFYNIAFVCLAFAGLGVFTAFDDAQTDEQKVEAAYNVLLEAFTAEKTAACQAQALAQATTDFAAMEAAALLTTGESTEQPKKSGTKSTPKSTGGNTGGTSTGGTETPVVKEDPKPDPTTVKGGSVKAGDDKSVTTKGGSVKAGDDKSVTTKGGSTKK